MLLSSVLSLLIKLPLYNSEVQKLISEAFGQTEHI